jgi:hypothetical protein
MFSDEKTGLLFTTATGPRQWGHSPVRVPWDSWPHSRHPQPGGPGPRNNIPQEQGGPVILPGTIDLSYLKHTDMDGVVQLLLVA